MFMMGTMGFGVSRVSGRSRVPSPPTRTTACTDTPGRKEGWAPAAAPRDLGLDYGGASARAFRRRSLCQWDDTPNSYAESMRKRYDWGVVQAFYDAGNDRKACMGEFGFTAVAWYKAIQRRRLRAELQ